MVEIERCRFAVAQAEIAKRGGFVAGAPANVLDDQSFFITDAARVLAIVPAFFTSGLACHFDLTSIIPFRADPAASDLVNNAICEWTVGVLTRGEIKSVKILAEAGLAATLTDHPALTVTDNSRVYGYSDLRRDEAKIWQTTRRRYRSFIHAGEQAFTRTLYSGADAIDDQTLDFLTASRRPAHTYAVDRVENHIAKMRRGEATLFSFRRDVTVVGVIGIASWQKFLPQGDHFYELGAYDRSSDIPTHFCMFDALRYYRQRSLGGRVFLLHGVPEKRPPHESKLANIDHFKMGFCSDTFTRPYKTITLALD